MVWHCEERGSELRAGVGAELATGWWPRCAYLLPVPGTGVHCRTQAGAQPLGVPNGTGSQAQHRRGLGAPEAMPRTRRCMGLGCPSASEDGSTGTCRPRYYTGECLSWPPGEEGQCSHTWFWCTKSIGDT